MDRELIEQKLESLRRCVRRVRERCPSSPEALKRDADAQDIVTLNLTRAIQLCVDIGAHLIADGDFAAPDTMGHTFDMLAEAGYIDRDLAIRLKKAVGFRNIVIHNYHTIDWHIVHVLATKHLDDFKDYARAVIDAAGLRAQGGDGHEAKQR